MKIKKVKIMINMMQKLKIGKANKEKKIKV